jgi:prepilin-type N-terminal cleavage/methylation domain-containing protein
MNEAGKIEVRQRGVTLIEMSVTLLVLAVIVVVAVPSFRGMYERRRVVAAAEQVYNQLRLARSEAIKRSAEVHASFSDNDSVNWSFGISDDAVTCDSTAALGTANDCTLDIDGTDVLEAFSSEDYPNVSMTFSSASIDFDPIRGTAQSLTVSLVSGDYWAQVRVSPLGAVRLCSPDGSVWGMPAC